MKYPTNNEIWYAEQRDLAIEERDAAITRAEAAEAEAAALRARIAELEAADQWRPKNSGSVPDEHEPVFAMVDKNGVEHPAIVEYSDGQWFNSWIRVHVTRWLPPPAPPTEAPAP